MLLYIDLTFVFLDITVFDPDGMENRITQAFLARGARASLQMVTYTGVHTSMYILVVNDTFT